MSVTLFKEGKVWHYRFQVALNRVQRSTRTSNKTKAEQIAERAYSAAILLTNGGKPVPTLAELVEQWLRVQRPVISVSHARSVDAFRRLHMQDLGDKPINEITTGVVEAARNEHLLTHAPASVNHWLRILKLVVNWAVKCEVIPRLPWKVRELKLQKRPRTILPITAAAEWFAAIDKSAPRSSGIQVAVRLMLFLGLRESEAISARWEWIDWARGTYTPGITKGREAEPLPMPKWLINYLTPIRKLEGPIVAKENGAVFAPGFSRLAMHAANDVCATKGITPHRLRGTIATLMSENGVPIQTIQKFLRHKSPLTTMSYLEKNMSTVAKVQDEIVEKIGMPWRESGGTHKSEATAI